MTKKHGAVRKASTHFEQVPVHVAKKVADGSPSTVKTPPQRVVVELPSGKTQRHLKSTF
jgi:hypothetical protein